MLASLLAAPALQGQTTQTPGALSQILDAAAVNATLDRPGPPQVEPVFDVKHAPFSSGSNAQLTAWFGPIGGYFPERADRYSVSGGVVLQCAVSAEGRLSECSTLIESPAGWGFVSAANKMIASGYLTTKPAPGAKDGDPARILI